MIPSDSIGLISFNLLSQYQDSMWERCLRASS